MPAGFRLADLRVAGVERIYLADEKCLDVGVIATLSYRVGTKSVFAVGAGWENVRRV